LYIIKFDLYEAIKASSVCHVLLMLVSAAHILFNWFTLPSTATLFYRQ